MNLLAIAYPGIASAALQAIEDLRRQYDPLYDVVHAHFTLAFPTNALSIPDFTAEIKKQAAGIQPVHFSLDMATVVKDHLSNNYDVFLVPRKGYDAIIALHDKLYNGILSGELHTDIPYIPHITIARSADKAVCEQVAGTWNVTGFKAAGVFSAIDIVKYDGENVEGIWQVKLVV